MTDKELETREVTVDDPKLSPEAREALTDELRKAVGAKEVRVPKDTPHREHDVGAGHSGVASVISENLLLIAITLVAALIVGAIIALAAHDWWVLVIPLLVHFVGTLVIATLVVRMTTGVEAPDPTVTTQLEEEGVTSPERVFNELVDEYAGRTGPSGAKEVVTTGQNTDERTEMSPSEGSEPAGDYSMVMGIEWVIMGALAVASIALAFVIDDAQAWLLPVVMVPIVLGWMAYQVIAHRHAAGKDDT